MSLPDAFAPAQDIADAVLYEGYVLYPYRASSDKNKLRWQWGVVGPQGAHTAGVGEEPRMAVDLPVLREPDTVVRLRLRALRIVSRRVERLDGDRVVGVDAVTLGEETHVSFDDSESVVVDCSLELGAGDTELIEPFALDAGEEVEQLGEADGVTHQLRRRRIPITGEISVVVRTAGEEIQILQVEVRNTTGWPGGDRDEANLHSLVGAHVLGAVERGLFVSTTDPPEECAASVDDCSGHRLWPVVIGAPRCAALVLASPVILADQPEIAPESQGSFYDGLEIDELLSLRVLTMTDEEKAEARATDPRSRAIVDRVEAMDAEDLAALHGTIRSLEVTPPDLDLGEVPTIVGDGTDAAVDTDGRPWWDPGVDERFDPDSDGVVVAGEAISRGSVVRLHPAKRADAHDIFYRDRVATVSAIIHDVDGSVHVAVTVDDDPAADLNEATGRYLYFSPDEVEPLGRRVER